MNARFLFPHYLKRVGIFIAVPFTILEIIPNNMVNLNFSIDITSFSKKYSWVTTDNLLILINDVHIIGTIIGLMLIAFSKEKIEDEYVSTLRLESLQWSIYFNFALLILFTILINGFDFYTVSIYNMFTPLIFFILRFNYILHFKSYTNELERGGQND